MMRINLLPPEILEKRKAEKRIVYVVMAALLVIVILAVVYVYAYMRVDSRQQELDAKLQEVSAAQAKADMLAVFEQKELNLQARADVANTALADRMNWSKLFDELSLVLPTDMWVTSLAWSEDAGVAIAGFAVDSEDDSPDVGHKSIAKMLVRLADLDDLFDVWLGNSVKTIYLEEPAIQFSATARVRTSTDSASIDASATAPTTP